MRKLLIIIFVVFPSYLAALDSQQVTVEELARASRSWDGSELPPYKQGEPQISILKITVQPGVALPWHTHPIINAGVLVKGTLTVITKSGERHELLAGDAIVEVVGKVHKGINTGTEPAEIIVFYAGVVETPLTLLAE